MPEPTDTAISTDFQHAITQVAQEDSYHAFSLLRELERRLGTTSREPVMSGKIYAAAADIFEAALKAGDVESAFQIRSWQIPFAADMEDEIQKSADDMDRLFERSLQIKDAGIGLMAKCVQYCTVRAEGELHKKYMADMERLFKMALKTKNFDDAFQIKETQHIFAHKDPQEQGKYRLGMRQVFESALKTERTDAALRAREWIVPQDDEEENQYRTDMNRLFDVAVEARDSDCAFKAKQRQHDRLPAQGEEAKSCRTDMGRACDVALGMQNFTTALKIKNWQHDNAPQGSKEKAEYESELWKLKLAEQQAQGRAFHQPHIVDQGPLTADAVVQEFLKQNFVQGEAGTFLLKHKPR